MDTDELLRRLVAGDSSSSTSGPSPSTPPAISLARCTSRWRVGRPARRAPRDPEVVAYCRGQYCVLAHDAVRLLTGAGLRAKRATEGCLSGGSPECPSSPAQPEPTRTRCGTTSAWAEAADKRPLPD